ncbi:transcriptional regulator PpsR [Rivibacter subsaxonicus]|uniref:Transcriptional regulator PpsR n=1 Tax=Rivibacter subsaxonicus TaxID=457575 RepID=A0A4Q7W2J6_9BURK|nr:transcriptional regulator PpsR [Rivibacter subsaxonicus]RZU02879.1 transcriptional regulator PpsR [Rivibacter subsaxonicus]
MSAFDSPTFSLAGLDGEAAASVIAVAADVALMLDGEGVIRDVSVGNKQLALDGYRKWVGRSWAETVTVESRPKVAALLKEAGAAAARKWRHINHPSPHGADVPLLYSTIQVGKEGSVVALGRDLSAVAALQQRLVDAQQSMERDYLRLRHMETRYRHLFESALEAVLVVDGASQKVLEVNPAACQLIGDTSKRIVGRALPEFFDAAGGRALLTLLGGVRAVGRAQQVTISLGAEQRELSVSASSFRQEGGALFLVRLHAARELGAAPAPNAQTLLARAIERVPDGFVVTDAEGRVLAANSAFVEMTQLAASEQLVGQSLERWLGRSGVDLSVLLANLRQHGAVRLFATTVSNQYGSSIEAEISAAAFSDGERSCFGFTLRDVGRRLGETPPRQRRELPRSVAQLTELVGRMPLKDIVGETTDLIEQLCIEAALELTRNNRASASEMLGLSRQSLYVKLRRYNLGDSGGDGGK